MSSSIEDLLQIEKIQQYYQSFQVSRRDIQPKSYHTDSGTSSTLSNAMGLPLLGTCSSPTILHLIEQSHSPEPFVSQCPPPPPPPPRCKGPQAGTFRCNH